LERANLSISLGGQNLCKTISYGNCWGIVGEGGGGGGWQTQALQMLFLHSFLC
jgi:hypothetical protein